jgi:hypothetical protein
MREEEILAYCGKGETSHLRGGGGNMVFGPIY